MLVSTLDLRMPMEPACRHCFVMAARRCSNASGCATKGGQGDAHLLRDLGEGKQVGGGGAQHRGAEVQQQLKLALRLAAGGWQHRGSEPFRTIMIAESAGEQAVAVSVLYQVSGANAGGVEGAGDQLGPQRDVLGGVSGYARSAAGAARCL